MIKKDDLRKVTLVSLFAVAMGLLEAAVVVYLRGLYYPSGFNFPITFFTGILNVEWTREMATIVMLVCIGLIAGKKFNEKMAYFFLGFAVWDIFYYVFLRIFLDWPASLMTWDILFLIPWPWASPLLAPIICSLTMILFAFILIRSKDKKINFKEWLLLSIGSLLILYTFMYNYGKLIISGGFFSDFFNLATNQKFSEIISAHIPVFYNWGMFLVGEICILFAIVNFYSKQ